jgi:general secretion pathway protein I
MRRGFSLLEVMFAVALFGAVVTLILSAQGGLINSNRSAANMSQAVEIARCRMSELEEKELRLGYPEVEEKDESTLCCDDKEVEGFACDWQVERVKLPEVQQLGGDASLNTVLSGGLGGVLDGGLGSIASSLPTAAGTTLLNPLGGAGLNFDAGLGGLGQGMQSMMGGAGAQGLLSMVFGIVYPSLKPVLETAIRRITVDITWKEGSTDRTFTLTQYVTNPSRAGLLAGLADGGMNLDGGGGILGGLLGGSAPGSTAAPAATGLH